MTYAINFGDMWGWTIVELDEKALANLVENLGQYIEEILTLDAIYDKYADRFPVKLYKEELCLLEDITLERLLNVATYEEE